MTDAVLGLFLGQSDQGEAERLLFHRANRHGVVAGAPPSCIRSVGRVTNGAEWPLWLQVTLPPDWRSYPLYQSLRLPRPLRQMFPGEAE